MSRVKIEGLPGTYVVKSIDGQNYACDAHGKPVAILTEQGAFTEDDIRQNESTQAVINSILASGNFAGGVMAHQLVKMWHGLFD